MKDAMIFSVSPLRHCEGYMDKLEFYKELFSFEEILEQNDLTEDDVLNVLFEMGYVRLPEYLENEYEEEEA